jgi:sugar (pentulose or hexulose) kinase
MTDVPVIAIFDIGKTNKKFFLIDQEYKIVLERTVSFDEILDEEGDPCEDVQQLSRWVIETLEEVIPLKKFEIKAINFSAYGASLVYIDKNGLVIAPLYSYLKEYPQRLKNDLYTKYGGIEKISCETSSPELGSLNSGMQLYRMMREQPERYEQIKYALHLPQYISYLVTHVPCSDMTSIGSHTQLWDYQKNTYHQWVTAEGLNKKLAPILASDKAINIVFADKKLKAGTGLHDSSAALIPYLTAFKDPFVLISTGTWCISLNPFNHTALSVEELKQDCLCYLEYTGRPVKASRLFAGYEHEQETKRLANHFGKPVDYYKKIKYDGSIVASVQRFFKSDPSPGQYSAVLDQSGFCNLELDKFSNYKEAYHCLLFDIIRKQYHSTQLVIQGSTVKRIFVDGGFSNNSIYMHLLAQVFPQFEVYAAFVGQATAMGAALAIHKEWNAMPVPADMIKLKLYKVAGKEF